MSVKGGLSTIKEYALSDGDIRKVLGDDISIVTYPQLEEMTSIDQCFDRKGRCILFFPTTSPQEGHWCCMLRKKDHIYFFDPYGEAPEEQKDSVPESMKKYLEIDEPALTHLFKASRLPIYYNTYPFQAEKSGVNTCGRWCVARLLYATKSDEYFKRVVDKFCKETKLKPDDFAASLLANWLKK